MDPLCVSKYCGFHVAKGTNVTTIKKDISYLSQMPFYIYNKCINGTSTFGKAHTKKVQAWFTNLMSQLTSQVKASIKNTPPSTTTKGTTLHEVWVATNQEIDEHLEELKVMGVGGLGGGGREGGGGGESGGGEGGMGMRGRERVGYR